MIDREIFELNLSVETTSAYILLCSLWEKGKLLTLENISPFWQGTPAQLSLALEELEKNGVIEIGDPDEKGKARIVIKRQCDWG